MDWDDFAEDAEWPNQADRTRLDAEWTTLNGLREVFGIALKGTKQPTYSETLELAEIVAPDLFADEQSVLARRHESGLAKEYQQKAQALSSIQKRKVTPVEVIDEEINELDTLISQTEDNDKLRERTRRLYEVRRELTLKRQTENRLIFKDAFNVERELPISGRGDNYRDYELPNNRVLRIRVLHPDKPEHITGADVIYENYWDAVQKVRLAAIQYKIWEGRKIYQDDRMAEQLKKMQTAFCDVGICNEPSDEKPQRYRLPYCCAFLRPTDRLQRPDDKLLSSGYHVPLCTLSKFWHDGPKGGKQIRSQDIRGEAITHKIFEEMFNTNMLGSKWLSYQELETLYRKYRILETYERIVIHAQEYGVKV